MTISTSKKNIVHRVIVRFRVFDQEQKPMEFECLGRPFLYLIKRRVKLATNPGFAADEGISQSIDEEMASVEHVRQKEHCSTAIIHEIEVDNDVSMLVYHWQPIKGKYIRRRTKTQK